MGTEHRRVRCFQRGRCSLTNPELSVWQVVASGYDEQKEKCAATDHSAGRAGVGTALWDGPQLRPDSAPSAGCC